MPENVFPTLFLIAEGKLVKMIFFSVNASLECLHSVVFAYIFLFAVAAIFVGILEFYGTFEEKLTRKIHITVLYACL